jgi:hypothetical protein
MKEDLTFDTNLLYEISTISGMSKHEVLKLFDDSPYCDLVPDLVARKAAIAKAMHDFKAIKKLPSQIPFNVAFHLACRNSNAMATKVSPPLTKYFIDQMYKGIDEADDLLQGDKAERFTQNIKKIEQHKDRWDAILIIIFMDWRQKHLPCFEIILRRNTINKENQWQQIADDYINSEGYSNLEPTKRIFKNVSVNNLKQRYHRCLDGILEEARKKFNEQFNNTTTK